jgi:hypothetical protein
MANRTEATKTGVVVLAASRSNSQCSPTPDIEKGTMHAQARTCRSRIDFGSGVPK